MASSPISRRLPLCGLIGGIGHAVLLHDGVDSTLVLPALHRLPHTEVTAMNRTTATTTISEKRPLLLLSALATVAEAAGDPECAFGAEPASSTKCTNNQSAYSGTAAGVWDRIPAKVATRGERERQSLRNSGQPRPGRSAPVCPGSSPPRQPPFGCLGILHDLRLRPTSHDLERGRRNAIPLRRAALSQGRR